jgi:hypothetical protein
MRFNVPSWSFGPHRPQFDNFSANSVNEEGMEAGTGVGTNLL